MIKPYWRYQILGWGILFLLDISNKLLVGITDLPLFGAVIMLYGIGFVVSHLMRICYQQWRRKGLVLVIPGIIVTSFVGAIVTASVLVGTLILIQHPLINVAKDALHLLFLHNFIILSIVLTIWSSLYFLITRQHKVTELESTQIELEHTLHQAQLNALLTQLNPHFIFNCINNIRALILENPSKARDMLANLADMLRYNLQTDAREKTPLSSELLIVDTYIALMKMQYEERLKYELSIEKTLLESALVPRLILQLLVENAIKHGVGKQADGGSIRVDIKEDEQQLCIVVENPGVFTPGTKGIGINNIRDRLALSFCDKYTFTLGQEGESVVAKLQFPLEFDESRGASCA